MENIFITKTLGGKCYIKAKLNEYYIRNFVDNIILTTIAAIIPTFLVMKLSKKLINNLSN